MTARVSMGTPRELHTMKEKRGGRRGKKREAPYAASYSLRKRSVTNSTGNDDLLRQFVTSLKPDARFIVFSGSGLSADAGVSMFTTNNGLYARAQKRFRVANGQKLLSYDFYEQRPRDAQAFFASIYEEVLNCQPGRSHHLLHELQTRGHILQHYTLNIDGLSRLLSDQGLVEIHGNIQRLFCPSCGNVCDMTLRMAQRMKQRKEQICASCLSDHLRSRIVLYQDKDSEKITPAAALWTSVQQSANAVDDILWIGMSFKQAASIEYFNKVCSLTKDTVRHVIVNPDEETEFYLRSGVTHSDVSLLHLQREASVVLEAIREQR